MTEDPGQGPPLEVAPQRWAVCPACASDASRPFVSFDAVGFVRCESCRLVYKQYEAPNLRPEDYYERDYFHGRRSARDRRFAHRVRKSMRQIRLALGLQPLRSVLDVGCSLGYVVEAAQRLGMTAAGTDVSQYAVDVCRERGYRVEVGTLEELPFADGEFDLVVMKHVLEHTPEPVSALAEVQRVLRSEGLVMIMVPSLRYWKAWLLRRSCRYFRPDDLGRQHYFYCTPSTLRRLLQRAGYEVVTTSKAFIRPRGWVRPLELLRFGVLWLWQTAALALHLQREVFALARPPRPAASANPLNAR